MKQNFYANILESVVLPNNSIDIEKWVTILKENNNSVEIEIIDGNSIDINGDLIINSETLGKSKNIPFKINKINGNLTIDVDLKSFVNFPSVIKNNLYINNCYSPTSFEFITPEMNRFFINDDISLKKIKSLEFYPIHKDRISLILNHFDNLSWSSIVETFTKADINELNSFENSYEYSIYVKILKGEKISKSDLDDLSEYVLNNNCDFCNVIKADMKKLNMKKLTY